MGAYRGGTRRVAQCDSRPAALGPDFGSGAGLAPDSQWENENDKKDVVDNCWCMDGIKSCLGGISI